MLAAVASSALVVYATRIEPYRPVLRRRTIRVPANWPALDILHISDLHLRRSDQRLYRAQLKTLQNLRSSRPDLVCVTGDLCEKLEDVPLVSSVLARLSSRLGTFISLGNHEYNAPTPAGLAPGEAMSAIFYRFFVSHLSRGADEADAIVYALRQAGLCVLRNQGLRIDVGHHGLWLGGVDSAWAGRADVAAALQGRLAGDGALVMIHEPESAFEAAERGADLVLAGHTHGGQVRLPIVGAPYSHRVDPRIRIAAGLQPIGKSLLHITSGLGQLLPLRFACPPEVVWLHCVPTSL